MNPVLFIETIRSGNPYAVDIYTKGGCYNFHEILLAKYPESEAFYDGDHVITKIEGEYYDITGKVKSVNHIRMTQEDKDEAKQWKKDFKLNITGMLNSETIEGLGKVLGLSAEDLTAKLTSESEEGLNIPSGVFMTEEELQSRDNNEYKKGKKAGAEIIVKDTRKELGFEFEGSSMSDLVEAIRDQAISGLNKDKSEWQKANEKQKEAYELELSKVKEERDTFVSKYKTQELNNEILTLMPKETIIGKEAVITLFNAAHKVVEEDGEKFIVRNGNKLIDEKSTAPLTLETVFNDFVTTNGYAKAQGGRGGSNDGIDPFTNAKTPEAFQQEWQKKNPGKTLQSPEYRQDYTEFREKQMATA